MKISSLNNIIDNLDFYGFTPNLYIGNHKKSGTLFGFCLSFLTLILYICVISYFIEKLFNNSDVNVLTSTKILDKIDNLKLNKNSFYFNFYLEHPYNYTPILDESIYYPKVYYKEAIRNNIDGFEWIEHDLNVSNCELNDFGEEYQQFYLNRKIENMYCIKNLNESIYGSFVKEKYSFIYIELYECKNTSISQKCKSHNEINNLLDGSFISIEYQSFSINPKNYKNPNKPCLNEFYTSISHNYYKEIHLYLKKLILKTDNGFIFENINEKKFIQLDYSNDMISFKQNNKHSNFMEISIKYSDKNEEIHRSYLKVQNVISQIGGFINSIYTTFSLINYFFTSGIIYEKIINKIFYINFDKNLKPSKSLLKLTNYKKKVFFDINNMYNNSMTNYNNSMFIEENSNQELNFTNKNIKNTNLLIMNIKNNEKNKYNNQNIIKILLTEKKNNINDNISNKIYNNQNDEDNNNKNFNIININKFKINRKTNSLRFSIKNKIKISYFESLFPKLYKKKNNNIMLFFKGKKIIQQNLDIIYIIKNNYQLYLMKNMFFETEHITLMNYFIKTELSELTYDDSITNINRENNLKSNKVHEAYQTLIKRLNDKQYNNIDLYKLDKFIDQLINRQII